MELPIDAARMGRARCDRAGARGRWDAEARRFTETQSVSRSTGLPEWEGSFSVLGGTLRVSWSAAELEIEPGDIVTFAGLSAREGRSGRWFFSATSVEVAS